MIESINSAIREWEEGAFRLHGPRVVSLDRASGKIEVRAAFSEMTAPTQHLEQSTSAETAEGPVPSSTPPVGGSIPRFTRIMAALFAHEKA
jgi:hypothetical protein